MFHHMRMPTLLGNGKAVFVLKTYDQIIVDRNESDDSDCESGELINEYLKYRKLREQKVCLFSV